MRNETAIIAYRSHYKEFKFWRPLFDFFCEAFHMTVCVCVCVPFHSLLITFLSPQTLDKWRRQLAESLCSANTFTRLYRRGAELTTDTNGHFPCHILDEAVRQLDTPRPSSAEGGPEGGRAQALLIIFMSPADSNDHDLWLIHFVLLFLCEVFTHFPCFSMFTTLIQA